MSMFSGFLQKIANFLSDADDTPAGKAKPGIQELAAKRLQALTGRFEMVEAQVRLAQTLMQNPNFLDQSSTFANTL